MAESGRAASGLVFLSYRRRDAGFPANSLYERLRDHVGRDQVFKDVDNIDLGDDFADKISDAVGFCKVLLALIGDRWLTITDEEGKRRIDNANDFVRLEIEVALARGVRIIPILVDGARMPREDDLPASIARLARLQALELRPDRFDSDLTPLIRTVDSILSSQRKAKAQVRREARGQVAYTDQVAYTTEQIIYDSRGSITFSNDFVGGGGRIFKPSEGRYVGGKAQGVLSFLEGGIIDLYRTNNDGKYELKLVRYSYRDGDDNEILPGNPALPGKRHLTVNCEARVTEPAHSLRFLLKTPSRIWLKERSFTVNERNWMSIDCEFVIDPAADCYLRIDDYDVRSVPSSLQIRNIILAERK